MKLARCARCGCCYNRTLASDTATQHGIYTSKHWGLRWVAELIQLRAAPNTSLKLYNAPFVCERASDSVLLALTNTSDAAARGWVVIRVVGGWCTATQHNQLQNLFEHTHRSACSSSSFLVISLIRRLFRFTSWNLLEYRAT